MAKLKYRDAIKEAITEELRKDPDLILIGEEIRQGYQGCFGVTKGLCEEFGPDRMIDTPIAEASIIGAALGASMLGLKTIAEIMFEDFITVCFDGIVNQAAKIRTISGGQYIANMVIRTPGGASGLGVQHSQCLESVFMHFPGLYIAMPSNAYDAKGLLKTAINYGHPVLFFEHQRLYNLESEVPDHDYSIEFGKANIIKEGKDLTVVAFSYMVKVASDAIAKVEKDFGITVELIDPRTLVPMDYDAIIKSVKKTSKLVIVEEGVLRSGVGSEIAAQVQEMCFDWLDAPIKRIASKNYFIPLSPVMADVVLPGVASVYQDIVTYLSLG
jgi:acetoin:2,6-dichlorophenolindophenol oxidoreductase subunit beta